MENFGKPYTNTTPQELESIALLEHLLDKTFVKPHISKYDKVPNHDGRIEITNETQHFLGEFSIQVKTMNSGWGLVFYFEPEFLAYCKICLLPILVFLADKDNQQVYWTYIGPENIVELEKQQTKSVIVRFHKNKVISAPQKGYLSEWNNILTIERENKVNREAIKIEAEKLKKQLSHLKKLKDNSYQKSQPSFEPVHVFLDYYNGLLDGEFKIIKNVLYPGIWKIGIAIEEYTNDRLQFIKYPIPLNTNDTLIKIVKTDNKARIHELASSYIGYHKNNPIKEKDSKLAHDLLETDLDRIFNQQYLEIVHPVIANEVLIQFIDDFYSALGLNAGKDRYSVNAVEKGLFEHLGLLYEELNIIGQNNPYNPAKLEHIWYANYEDLKPFLTKAKARLKNRETISYNYQIYSDEYDIPYIIKLLWYLKSNGITTVERIFNVRHIYGKRPVIAQSLPDEKIKLDLECYFNSLHEIYNLAVLNFFPELYAEIQYFKGFQKEIILWGRDMVPSFERNSMVEVNIIGLIDSTPGIENTIEFIRSNSHSDPSLNKRFFVQYNQDPLSIDGHLHQRASVKTRSLNFLNKKMPLYHAVYDMLRENIKAYLNHKS